MELCAVFPVRQRFYPGVFPVFLKKAMASIDPLGLASLRKLSGFHRNSRRKPYWKSPPVHTRAGSGNIGPLWDRIELGYIGHYTSALLFSSLALKK